MRVFGNFLWASFHYEQLSSCMTTTASFFLIYFFFQFVSKMLSLKHFRATKLRKASSIDGEAYSMRKNTQVNWREVYTIFFHLKLIPFSGRILYMWCDLRITNSPNAVFIKTFQTISHRLNPRHIDGILMFCINRNLNLNWYIFNQNTNLSCYLSGIQIRVSTKIIYRKKK